MRRLGLAAVALVLVATATPSMGAPEGTIRGRILNATDDTPVTGVSVTLTGQGADADDPLVEVAVTDGRGSFRFKGLATGSDRFYALDAVFEGGRFSGPALAIPDDTAETPVLDTTLRVWPTTTDPAVILIRRDDLFVVPGDTTASVVESVVIVNTSDRAYIGRGGDGDGDVPGPSLGFALPGDARAGGVFIRDASIEIPQIVPTEYGFATNVAIPPGETSVTFVYPVTGAGGTFDVSRRALYPVLEFSVFAQEPLRVSSNRLIEGDEVTLPDQSGTFRRWSSDAALDAGDSIQALAIAEAGTTPGLIAGLVVLGLGLVGGAGWALAARRRRTRTRSRPRPRLKSSTPPARDRSLTAIAELDLAYRNGAISESEWAERRQELRTAATTETVEPRS